MADKGNNDKELALKQAEVDELTANLEKAKAEQIASQEMIQRQAGEVGEDRTTIKKTAEIVIEQSKLISEKDVEMRELKSALKLASKELVEVRGVATVKADEQETEQELLSSLSSEQVAEVGRLVSSLSDEDQKKIASDSKLRAGIILKVKGNDAETVTAEWWNTSSKTKEEPAKDADAELARMFKDKVKINSFVPRGGGGGGGGSSSPRKSITQETVYDNSRYE